MDIKIGIAGLGTIGTGLVHLIQQNSSTIAEKTGINVIIQAVADLDLQRDRDIDLSAIQKYSDAMQMLEAEELDVLVELIGGTDFALKLVLKAIDRGCHVVSANKALLATHAAEIYSAAEAANLLVGIEASVAGGIPVIKTIRESLAGNKVEEIRAIINGTTNYILTKMSEEGQSFEAALAQAQKLGFAEADPALDINGGDAAHKIAILAALAFNTPVSLKDVYREGIEGINQIDVQFAEELGYVVKLIAVARDRGELGVEARVHPMLVPHTDQLAGIRNEFNAVFLRCDYLGEAMLTGRGAGAFPTASAVVSDIIDMGRRLREKSDIKPVPKLAKDRHVVPFGKTMNKYYLRCSTKDHPGILAEIAGILGAANIGIASLIQQEIEGEDHVPVVFITHVAEEAAVAGAVSRIDKLDSILQPTVVLRAL